MSSSNRRQLLSIAFAIIFASTLLLDVALVNAQGKGKKKLLLKALAAGAMIVKYTKPRKGILPIPLPLPVPLPIEWEQPPVIVHPKQQHVPIPEPIPVPVPMYGGHGYGGGYGGYY